MRKKLLRAVRRFSVPSDSMGRAGLIHFSHNMHGPRLKISGDAAKSIKMKMQVKARKIAEHGKSYAKNNL